MMRAIVIALVFAATLSAGEPSKLEPKSTIRQSGGTVLSPNEAGWVAARTTDDETVLVKKSETDLFTLSMKTFKTEPLGSGTELLVELEARKGKELDSLDAWARDSLHFYYTRFKGMPCLQYDGAFAAKKPAPNHGYFNFKGYVCSLSADGDRFVQLEASHETEAKGISTGLADLADEFFATATIAKSGD